MLLAKVARRGNLIERQSVNWVQCPRLRDFGLLEVGVTHAGEGWCFIRPEPFFGLVIATVSGTGAVLCDGKWQDAGAETLYTMPPGSAHGYRLAGKHEWRYAWAMFETVDGYPELFTGRNASLMSAPCYSLDAANRGLFGEVIRTNDPQLLSIWCDLIRASLATLVSQHKIDPCLRELWQVVTQKISMTWSIDAMVAQTHMGRERLRTLCQRYYGRSPRQYLTQLRLRKACELLRESDHTLDAVASQIGFNDAFSFSKAFSREYRMPPSKYRSNAKSVGQKDMMI